MFKDLFDFGMQRTPVQALGFWITYFLLCLLIGAVVGIIAAAPYQNDAQGAAAAAYTAGALVGPILSAILCSVICARKSLGVVWYLVPIFGVGLGLLGGGLLGVIPAAYLTTHPS